MAKYILIALSILLIASTASADHRRVIARKNAGSGALTCDSGDPVTNMGDDTIVKAEMSDDYGGVFDHTTDCAAPVRTPDDFGTSYDSEEVVAIACSNGANTDKYAYVDGNVGTLDGSTYTVYVEMWNGAFATSVPADCVQMSLGFDNTERVLIAWCSNGVYNYTSGSWTEIGTDIHDDEGPAQYTWMTWGVVVDTSNDDYDLYRYDYTTDAFVEKATSVSLDTANGTSGFFRIGRSSNTVWDQEYYMNWLMIGTGTPGCIPESFHTGTES